MGSIMAPSPRAGPGSAGQACSRAQRPRGRNWQSAQALARPRRHCMPVWVWPRHATTHQRTAGQAQHHDEQRSSSPPQHLSFCPPDRPPHPVPSGTRGDETTTARSLLICCACSDRSPPRSRGRWPGGRTDRGQRWVLCFTVFGVLPPCRPWMMSRRQLTDMAARGHPRRSYTLSHL